MRLNTIYKNYILENTSEDITSKTTNISEVCREILRQYDLEGVNHENNIRRIPNYQDRVKDHMMGIPSSFHPDFSNYEIEKNLRMWGIIKNDFSEKRAEKLVENWWNFWANYIIKQATKGRK